MLHNENDINWHRQLKAQALTQGKSVAVKLDARGNTDYGVTPHVFDSCAKLKAFADSNKHTSFNFYWGTVK